MQRLLGEAVWDPDAVRDDLFRYVADRRGEPQGVLIIDDTGDLKKGNHSVGVQRQYTGTAGRIENAQVGVFLGYATGGGYTLVDREIYLPRSWTDDPERCAAAGVPEQVGFATKITLARRMLGRALDAGIGAAWATADEFYGGDRHLRQDLQARGVGYVLAVSRSHRVTTCTPVGPQRVDRITAQLPARSWNRRSAGDGSKGWRDYDWAWVRLVAADAEACAGEEHYLLVRRSRTDGGLAFYRCWSPEPASLRTLVQVAGIRWSIETCFQTGKGLGLDRRLQSGTQALCRCDDVPDRLRAASRSQAEGSSMSQNPVTSCHHQPGSPYPAAEVSRSRVSASRAPSAPLRGRYATPDPPTRSQDRAAIGEQGTDRPRCRPSHSTTRWTSDTTMTGTRSHYARYPRF